MDFERENLFSSISPTFWSLQAPCWTHRRNKVYFTCKYLLKACIKDRSTKTFNLKKMQKWFSVMITTLMSKWWHQYFVWCRHHAIDYNNNGSNALIIDQGVSITLCYVLQKVCQFRCYNLSGTSTTLLHCSLRTHWPLGTEYIDLAWYGRRAIFIWSKLSLEFRIYMCE